MTIKYRETKYGFEYGNAAIERLASDNKAGWVSLGLETKKYPNYEIQIYVTKTGKVRIHSKGEWANPQIIKKELKVMLTHIVENIICNPDGSVTDIVNEAINKGNILQIDGYFNADGDWLGE